LSIELPKDLRDTLARELAIATEKMATATDLREQIYYFSASYGAVNRAFNVHWRNELGLLHVVLQAAHGAISDRLNKMVAGVELPIRVPNEVSVRLNEVIQRLADAITSDEIDEAILLAILADVATLTYSTTGNGYYLYLKGDLKI